MHKRRRSASRDAQDDILAADGFFVDGVSAAVGGIFSAFLGAEHGRIAAGDDALDHVGFGTKGGRTFGGVEDAEAATGAGADID